MDQINNKRKIGQKNLLRNHNGQAVTEYILMLSIIVSFYIAVTTAMNRLNIGNKVVQSAMKPFAACYQYGHPKAKGYDDGGPEYHPRASSLSGENNFRIFLNLGEDSGD